MTLADSAIDKKLPVVVFTGGGGAASEALQRLLHDRYNLFFADADPASIPDTIPAARKLAIPHADAADFIPRTAAVLAACRAEVLVPGVDEELPQIRDLLRHLPALRVLAPQPEFVLAMQDKFESARRLLAAGLDAPFTVTADRPEEIGFPCIAKPRSGRGSRGVMVLEAPAQVPHYLGLYRQKAAAVVLQEKLPGTEYTVYVSADAQARLCDLIPIRVLSKRGVTIRAEIHMESRVVAYCEALHRALRPEGPYNVQLILGDDGRVAPFEVNPRVSTTLCLAIAAGADPIGDWLGYARRHEVRPMRLKRNWNNQMTPMEGG
ncbi:ATP-grasp domain-containing protein [Sediminicoccus rosea]|uniref:ATP-grasp domain-containing protein n=1 Tax=Sediminicoccus rosea TaxID=1225128 RepID=A0ABZ0PPJ0_9PROT|nr:ATP-grasp domain-containing protein [Sediminicoccus rosea]WPB87455.1 ATP-grasp domain-containing protein [Sediminicoccus rosea]